MRPLLRRLRRAAASPLRWIAAVLRGAARILARVARAPSRLAAGARDGVKHRLSRGRRYRPERHYMRGPGPKCRSAVGPEPENDNGRSGAAETPPAAVRRCRGAP